MPKYSETVRCRTNSTSRKAWIIKRRIPETRWDVVIAGSGHFVSGDTRQPFEAGEVLFVLAGVDHRFEDFTDDFSSWVRPVAAGRVLERGIQTLLARRRQFPEEACPGNTPHGADRASISVSSNR